MNMDFSENERRRILINFMLALVLSRSDAPEEKNAQIPHLCQLQYRSQSTDSKQLHACIAVTIPCQDCHCTCTLFPFSAGALCYGEKRLDESFMRCNCNATQNLCEIASCAMSEDRKFTCIYAQGQSLYVMPQERIYLSVHVCGCARVRL
jgi:hypothetical protein